MHDETLKKWLFAHFQNLFGAFSLYFSHILIMCRIKRLNRGNDMSSGIGIITPVSSTPPHAGFLSDHIWEGLHHPYRWS